MHLTKYDLESPLCEGRKESNMKKTFKKFLALLMAFGMILSLCACGGDEGADDGSSADTIEWTFYSAYGPEDGACCAVWQDLFDRIYEETDGRLEITTYWYGQHPYEGEEMLKVVSDGTAQLAHFYSGYVESVDPALAVEALPLLMPVDAYEAYDILTALWGGFSGDTSGTLEAILQEKWGATMVHCMPASPQRLFTAGYDAVEPNSLAGHKIRSYSTATAEFVQALGGTPVSISLSETYTGLSTNLVDGLITSTLVGYNNGVFDFTDAVNVWEISSSTDGVMCNIEALNSLPEDVREIFMNIMNSSATAPETSEIDTNDELLAQLQEEGVRVVTPTDEFRRSIRDEMEQTVWAEWLETAGEAGQTVLDQVNSLL